jgi:hypothetical protein
MHTDTVDVFACGVCKVTPELVVDGGKAQLAIVRHQLGLPTLVAQTRTHCPVVQHDGVWTARTMTPARPGYERVRVLIAVKTYPNPSSKYEETVCVAGIQLDRGQPEWIRLYPVRFRNVDSYVHHDHPAERADQIAAAEQEAKAAGRGLWGPPCFGATASAPRR